MFPMHLNCLNFSKTFYNLLRSLSDFAFGNSVLSCLLMPPLFGILFLMKFLRPPSLASFTKQFKTYLCTKAYIVSIIHWHSLWYLTSFLSLVTEIGWLFWFCCALEFPLERGDVCYKSVIKVQLELDS